MKAHQSCANFMVFSQMKFFEEEIGRETPSSPPHHNNPPPLPLLSPFPFSKIGTKKSSNYSTPAPTEIMNIRHSTEPAATLCIGAFGGTLVTAPILPRLRSHIRPTHAHAPKAKRPAVRRGADVHHDGDGAQSIGKNSSVVCAI